MKVVPDRRRRRAFPAGTDVQQLAWALGGAATVPALWDCRYGVTLNAGKVSTWADARGSGATLTATGAPLPTIDATAGGVGVTTDGTQNYLRSGLQASFDLSSGYTMIHIGAMQGANFGCFLSNAAATQFIAVAAESSTIRNVYSRTTGGSLARVQSQVTGTATPRLSIASSSTAPGLTTQANPYFSMEVGGRSRVYDWTNANTVAQLASGSYELFVGVNPSLGLFSPFATRAILMLKGDVTAAQLRTIKSWATLYHAPTYDVRRSLICVGDSLTFGLTTSSPGPTGTTSWPSVVMAQTTPVNMTALYDGINLGVTSRALSEMQTLLPINCLRDLATFHSRELVTLWGGTNDIVTNGDSDTTVINRTIAMVQTIRNGGAKYVVGIPPIPREDAATTAPKFAILKSVSDWFQFSGASYFDAVVPLYNNSRFNNWTFGASSARDLTNYAVDKIHLTDVAQASVATDATNGFVAVTNAAGIL